MKITFEGIDAPNDNVGQAIQNDYAGMNWSGFSAIDPAGSPFEGSGLTNGIHSGSSVAYNQFGTAASFTSQTTDFAMRKAFFTGAWNNGMTVTVEAWDDGVKIGERSFIVNYDAPKMVKFGVNFSSVDTVVISTLGGIDADISDAGAGGHVAIDDIVLRFEDVLPTRVGGDGGHFDGVQESVAATEFDTTGFSHWMLS
jgi:hypothetical protein